MLAPRESQFDSRSRTIDLTHSSDLAPEAGELPRVPGYEVTDLVGRGGFGVVYRARHLGSGRTVALKFARGGAEFDPAVVRAFVREAEHLRAARHPNVVRTLGADCVAGRPFLALEFCPGDLKERLRAGPRLAPSAVAELVAGLARGAAAVHAAGLIHLDIKPENVLLAVDGTPRLADFGLARRVGAGDPLPAGEVFGTPAYLSPEQAAGDAPAFCPATDVWGIGVVLYEYLTGQRPYEGGNLFAVLRAVAQAAPPVPVRAFRSDVSEELEAVCLRCLRKDPAARYANGSELAAALEDAIFPVL